MYSPKDALIGRDISILEFKLSQGLKYEETGFTCVVPSKRDREEGVII
jgi:hypothetical protein